VAIIHAQIIHFAKIGDFTIDVIGNEISEASERFFSLSDRHQIISVQEFGERRLDIQASRITIDENSCFGPIEGVTDRGLT